MLHYCFKKLYIHTYVYINTYKQPRLDARKMIRHQNLYIQSAAQAKNKTIYFSSNKII